MRGAARFLVLVAALLLVIESVSASTVSQRAWRKLFIRASDPDDDDDDDDDDDGDCENINDQPDTCKYVQENCDDEIEGFLDYLEFYYCTMHDTKWLAIIIFVLGLLALFVIIVTAADEYFCPTLAYVAEALKLSDNVAGVTFLALGNGAADLSSAFYAFQSDDTRQIALGSLTGAGVFVATVVCGIIHIIARFKIANKVSFFRDVLFFMFASGALMFFMLDGNITLWEAACFIALYVVYVVIVVLQHKFCEKAKPAAGAGTEEKAEVTMDETLQGGVSSVFFAPPSESTGLLAAEDVNLVPPKGAELSPLPFEKFVVQWKQSTILQRIRMCIASPASILLTLTVPVTTEESWSWHLSVLHPMTSIMFIAVAASAKTSHPVYSTNFGDSSFPVWALILIIGFILSVVVFFTTNRRQRPRYQPAFALLGFVSAALWVYIIAGELVSLLQCLGMISGISQTLLGLTVLAWGNSLGDLVANTVVARNGMAQMAIGACYGGPLLNVLIGVGLSCTYASATQGHPLHVHLPPNIIAALSGLAAALLGALIFMTVTNFRSHRGFGIMLLVMYTGFFVTSILLETLHHS